jgi:hypothetical protein
MSDTRKDYAKVTEVSAHFNDWLADMRGSTKPVTSQDILVWQAKFQLIIAQQLTIIAGHLGKIVGKAERLNGSD